MYRACIFDLDGTLADTVESIAYVGNRVLSYCGLKPRPVEEYNFFAGDGVDVALKRALAAAGDTECVHYKEGREVFRQWFDENPLYRVKPFAGIPQLLEKLKEMEIKIAVFSNKPHGAAVHVVESLFGKECFDMIQGQTEVIPRKPAPDGAFLIARRFEMEPCDILYLGDTNTDMDTGIAAGMHTVGVTWGFRPRKELEEHHAMDIIDRPEQILDFFEAVRYD